MDGLAKLKLLSAQMHFEPAEDAGCPQPPSGGKDLHIGKAALPGGRQISLVKTLLTSACERNCYYCPFRAGRDFRRATFKADELAQTFMLLHRTGAAEGIFLSSGVVGGGLRTQDQLLDAADLLRGKLSYRGYLHLKIMPGAERAQVERAMRLADRVSINLEAPNEQRLQALAPRKAFLDELLQPLRWVEEIRRSQPGSLGWNGRWPSSATQFVVGAAGESDLELLATTERLYRQLRLGRAYYSAFSPIPDTPLDGLPAESPVRQRRLYQASFLMRDYGFGMEELPFDDAGRLPQGDDPKLAWARLHLQEQPLEVNHAALNELLRVPGVGPKGAQAILAARRQRALNDLSQLKRIGVNAGQAAPFILLDGKRPARQISFFVSDKI
ncbi:MAG: radical SAM protein [Chloroflexi bacterium]|nr:radical SAM protein [Chloroflexota bacterium]